ncbi:hypothetical protein ACIHCM_25365 [Streptomyces sp. NPDC052023]|uniref:hypothetical protein n=1 Tax=Streptomyces sp. NPDC052023 TaxID=3365681 RepID=UPI0037D3D337
MRKAMGKEHETGPQGELTCPICKQPLDMTDKRRRKTLGLFVPVRRPGPCRNPDCPEYLENPEWTSSPEHS